MQKFIPIRFDVRLKFIKCFCQLLQLLVQSPARLLFLVQADTLTHLCESLISLTHLTS